MPDLSVTLRSLTLKNPVLASSGTVGYGTEFAGSVDLSQLGGLITKTVTLKPREGNPPPRLAETPGGMINAVGLQNVGLDKFLSEKLPALRSVNTPVIVSVLSHSAEELAEMVGAVDKAAGAAAIELNLSCPNIQQQAPSSKHQEKEGRFVSLVAHDAQAVGSLVAAARKATGKPLIAKLSPDVTNLMPIAQAAENAGADAVAIANTYVGMSWDTRKGISRLGTPTGGVSGPAIRPLTLYRVWYVAQALRIPVIGLGGILRADDAIEYFLAGAAAVAVGTANFVDPKACVKIARGIENYLNRHNLASLKQINPMMQTGNSSK